MQAGYLECLISFESACFNAGWWVVLARFSICRADRRDICNGPLFFGKGFGKFGWTAILTDFIVRPVDLDSCLEISLLRYRTFVAQMGESASRERIPLCKAATWIWLWYSAGSKTSILAFKLRR